MRSDGLGSLESFEDKLLFQLVELTGIDRPLPLGRGVAEADLAERLEGDLDIAPGFARTPEFYGSKSRGTLLAAVQTLCDRGLAQCRAASGPWAIWPTYEGRERVRQWRREWKEHDARRERETQRLLLQELADRWRKDPENHRLALQTQVNVEDLCRRWDITRSEFVRAAQRLVDQGKIGLPDASFNFDPLVAGFMYITEAGLRALEVEVSSGRPSRGEEAAWVEVARCRKQLESAERRLRVAERDLPSLISDEQLRKRCLDLLEADEHYDRVVREASVILEDRVRRAIGAGKGLDGTKLMEHAFSASNPLLRLSEHEPEQRGAMDLYRGAMAFFRNDAGHNVIERYDQRDALRFVAFVDLLLTMVESVLSRDVSTPALPEAH